MFAPPFFFNTIFFNLNLKISKTDEHADLVFKLRTLLDKANDISLNCTNKLIKSSQTLQIIQSRLAYKQQLYADALLHKQNTAATATVPIPGTSNQAVNGKLDEEQSRPQTPSVMAGSLGKRFGSYLSGDEDDNESFVSADSVSKLFFLMLSIFWEIKYSLMMLFILTFLIFPGFRFCS